MKDTIKTSTNNNFIHPDKNVISLFDTDILEVQGSDILNAEPLMTIVNGKVAFDALN